MARRGRAARSPASPLAVVITIDLAAAARHAARLGDGARSPACSAGALAALLALGLDRLGLGRRRAGRSTSSPSASRRRWPPRSPSTCWPGPGRWRSASAPGSSSRPGPLRARAAAGRRPPALPRAGAPRPARGLRAVALERRTASAPPTATAVPPAARARGGRRRLHQARPDRRDPRRPAARRRCAPSWPGCRTGCRPSRRSDIAAVLEAELGDDVEAVFAEFDWEPLAAASIGQTYRARLHTGEAVVVKVQRPGIEEMMERDLAALGLLAEPRAAAHVVRPGRALGRDARPVRREPARRARLPARGRRDGRRWPLCLGERRTVRVPHGLPRALHPPAARPGALRGLHAWPTRDQLDAVRGRSSARWPSSCCGRCSTRCCGSGFFHADPHPGNVFVLRRRHARADRLRRRRPARPDPAGARSSTCSLALVRRDVSLLRDGIERVAELGRGGATGRARARARPADGRARAGRPARSTRRACRTWCATLARFGVRLPGRPRDAVAGARDARRHAARARRRASRW